MKNIIILLLISCSAFGQLTPANEISPFSNATDYWHQQFGLLNNSDEYVNTRVTTLTDSSITALLKADSVVVSAITYTDTYWDDLRVPLSNTRINPANSEPDFEATGKGFFAWGFDADSDSAYTLNFVAQLPHSYKKSTDIDCHLHWTPPDTNTGVVRWKVTYHFAAINGTITDAAYFWANDAGDGVAYKHQLIEFGDIDGTTMNISGMIIGSIARLGDHADDTYTGSAYGLELDFHFEMDRPGSEEELEKY